MGELTLLLAIAAALAAWADHRHVLEIAVARCRRACEAANVQFLDETAALSRVRLRRDEAGVVRLNRRFTFEYSTASGDRRRGELIMLGRRPLAVELENRAIIDNP